MKKILLILSVPIIYTLLYRLLPGSNYFPSSFELLQALIRNLSGNQIYLDIFASLQRVIFGFLIAGFLGITLGLLVGHDKWFRDLKIYVELLRPIPPIAWIPIAIIIFGLSDASTYFIVFLGAFFPIFTNTYFGVVSMPNIYRNIALSFEMGRMKFMTKILFFYSLPYIFTGLKIGMGVAWMSVIASELIAAQSGLGYFIQQNRLLLQTDNVIIGMMLIGIIGYLLQKIIEHIEKTVVRWR